MVNPYREYLNQFLKKMAYYLHISDRTNQIFKKDKKIFLGNGFNPLATQQAIYDWTGPTTNGWKTFFSSGNFHTTTNENYLSEIEKIYSRHLCLLFAQSFESFERLIKDCLFDRANKEGPEGPLYNFTISKLRKDLRDQSLTRERMPGGKSLFKILKKAGGETFMHYSTNNDKGFNYKIFWTIISEARHSITHKESRIESVTINQSDGHSKIFDSLFDLREVSDNVLLIDLSFAKFKDSIQTISEYGYQMYKILSKEENLEYEFHKT